jgi:dihydroorotate dehydrogenase electron transfer subunit
MLDRKVKLREVRDLGARNYLMTLSSPEQARLVHPGQFVMVKCCEDVGDDPLLRRPFSVFALQRNARTGSFTGIQILVKDVGTGTHKLVRVKPGQEVFTLGPQGRPFRLPADMADGIRYACLVAGGVGIAAVYLLAHDLLAAGVTPVLFYGARTAPELVLRDYFERLGIETRYTSEDGSIGERGLVTAPVERFLEEHGREGLKLYACGPWAMMRAVHALAVQHAVECEVSLEARMGCSLGACMGCVVQASSPHGEPHYIRVCMEGPVISSRLINWEAPPL